MIDAALDGYYRALMAREDEQIEMQVISWNHEYNAAMTQDGHLRFIRKTDGELKGEIWLNRDGKWEFNAYSHVVSYIDVEKLTRKSKVTFRYLDHAVGFAIRHLDRHLEGGYASFNGVRENLHEYLVGMFATKRKGE